MKVDEIRERFLGFFKGRGHTIYPSAPLVPEGDPSLLFTGSGMNQFKDMFLGAKHLPFRRATTSQKCLRTDDLDKVGKTSCHHTFFEMLGNFSFGDYFKEEAIIWAWEFLVKELKIPKERLYVSVYLDDNDAANIWRDKVGLPSERIFRLGAKDNFWPANGIKEGPDGPCGYCSEIFYDFGREAGCRKPSCNIGCNCGRFAEIWNLVFQEFTLKDGVLHRLEQKNVDTGAGLERLGRVLQNKSSNFEIDIFLPIVDEISRLVRPANEAQQSWRQKIYRIADHIRAITFCIADGVMPSNEGRGYVVRKLLRIAVRDAMSDRLKVGSQYSFLYKLVPIVADVMKKQYPELCDQKESIADIVRAEEERFLITARTGLSLLHSKIEDLKKDGKNILPGEEAFMFYDTFGFPLEVQESFLSEWGFKLDRPHFEEMMKKQKDRSQQGTKFSKSIFDLKEFSLPPEIRKQKTTEFIGYKSQEALVKVVFFWKVTGKENPNVGTLSGVFNVDWDLAVLLDKTPFYATSGGQMSDTGYLEGEDGSRMEIGEVVKRDGYFVHYGKVRGSLEIGREVRAVVDKKRRLDISRNHTATHILQSALREILGNYVRQAGSLVADRNLRFDFTYPKALTKDEIRKVEQFVFEKILSNSPITIREMPQEEAKKLGAMMLFGEKYGEIVRVVSIGDFSKECCGGTHLLRTGEIGCFKITNECSIAAGIRRIEAITGTFALNRFQEEDEFIDDLERRLGVPKSQIVKRLGQIDEEIQDLKRENSRLKKANFDVASSIDIKKDVEEIGGYKIIAKRLDDEKVEEIRLLIDRMIKKEGLSACIFVSGSSKTYVIGISDELSRKGLDAGAIAKVIGALAGKGGGGRKNMAQAGGGDLSKVEECFSEFRRYLKRFIEKNSCRERT